MTLGNDVATIDRRLATLDAPGRVAWALENLPGTHVVTSSFGAQAAVMLHLAAARERRLPVILLDTGHLFPETYRFVDELTERLGLDLRIYRAPQSAAWQEARYGRLWEQGPAGLERYLQLNKVEPLQRALRELGAGTWLSGLRRAQSTSRAAIRYAEQRDGRWKIHPLADWTDRDVGRYLRAHAGSAEQVRFGGQRRECGIHGL